LGREDSPQKGRERTHRTVRGFLLPLLRWLGFCLSPKVNETPGPPVPLLSPM
jgi:hypothetical protein